jgi:hypothetical protein
MPLRLSALVIIALVTGVVCLVRGLSGDGEPDVVYLVLGALALVGAFLIVYGWWRQSRRP